MYKVLVVDDQLTAQQIISEVIEASDEFTIFKVINNASLAEMCCLSGDIDLIIMDVYTAHGENGIIAASKIKKNFPTIKIIIVTSMAECSFIEKARQANCDSFWYKDIGEIELIEVMRETMSGNKIYPEKLPQVKIGNIKSTQFTARELEILREIVNGVSNKEICKKLYITKSTLDTHIRNMLIKTGYTSKIKLAVDIASKGLIIPDFWEEI